LGLRLPVNLKIGSFNIEAGTILDGRYEIASCLGQGGMGAVYRAFDRRYERYVAIKLISQKDTEDQRRTLRFKREAEATARLSHPSITKILDFGFLDGLQPYLVMDFAEGKTLSAIIAEHGQLPLPETISIFTAVCDGLAHAHENKVLHRDLKPSNIMVNRESGRTTVKILDFGIAKILESAGVPSLHITRTGELLGSPFYMSPEQAKGGPVDERSDLYSLGCTLYESLTGGPPHIGDSPMSTLLKRESDQPPRMSEASLGRKFPEQLEIIVAKLLKHDPKERYQSASDLKLDLLKITEQSSPLPSSTEAIDSPGKSNSPPESAIHQKPGRALLATAIALLLIAFCTAFAFVKWLQSKPVISQSKDFFPSLPQEPLSKAVATLSASTFKGEANEARNLGKYDVAARVYLQGISYLTSLPGNHADEIADLQLDLAYTYVLWEKFANASKVYEQALAHFDRTLPSDDPKLIAIYNILAFSYFHQASPGDRRALYKAQEKYERVEPYYEAHLPESKKYLENCLTELSFTLGRLGNTEGQKQALIKLLSLRITELGEKDPQILGFFRNIGGCCRQQKKYEEAINYDKRWVAAYNDSDVPQDDHVLALLALAHDYSLASADKNATMLRSARRLYMQALKICQKDEGHFQKKIGPALELTSITDQLLAKLGQSYLLPEAERFNLQALIIYERLKVDKKTIIALKVRTGDIQQSEHHFADAKATYMGVLAPALKILGENSPIVLNIAWHLVEICRDKGELNEADTYYKLCSSTSIRCEGAKSIKSRDILSGWAENARQRGNLSQARNLLADYVSICRSTLGSKNPETVRAEARLKAIDDSLNGARSETPSKASNQ
jgi:serine/threonine protein kinase